MENDCKVATRPKNAKEFFKPRNFRRPFLGVLLGSIAGFLYYHFVGCSTGSCPITSHSYTLIPFGGVMGYLITSGPCTRY
jgi:Family of unknown function (DUF6132)